MTRRRVRISIFPLLRTSNRASNIRPKHSDEGIASHLILLQNLCERLARDALLHVFKEVTNELEQVGPADPPLAIHRLYADRHCQLQRHGIGNASRLGSLLAAATALPAVVHGPVLVRVAVCRQVARRATRRRIGVNTMARTSEKSPKVAKKVAAKQVTTKPVLLSGGNPQIAKGDGDAPVQAYIAAMPGWKRDVGRRLDALIVRTAPGVRKAVKWNSPLYGVEGQGWFLGVHCFTKYVKVAFFRGTSLRPVSPTESKSKDTRTLNIHE